MPTTLTPQQALDNAAIVANGFKSAGPGNNFAVAPANPVAAAGTDFSSFTPKVDPALQTAQQNVITAAGMSTTPSASDISGAAAMFQSQIDALNGVYATQKKAALQDEANRTGSNTAIEARRGLIGSDFGNAATDKVNAANADEQAAIDAKHNLDLSGVYTNINKASQDASNARVTAAQKGADALLTQLKGDQADKITKVTGAVKAYLAAGNDGSKLTTTDIKSWSDQLGVDPSAVQNAVKDAITANAAVISKNQIDAANLQKIQEEIKTGTIDATKPVEIGGYIYKPDAKGGWTNAGQARSTANISPTTVVAQTVQEGYKTVAPQLDSRKGADGYVTPADYQTAKQAWITSGLPSADFDKQFVNYVNPTKAKDYGFDVATFNTLKASTTQGFGN